MERLTADELRSILKYNPTTGEFTRCANGETAGCLDTSKGRIRISVKGSIYMAHRLAWLYTHGKWPSMHIDHINGVPSDNRICNLREATPAQNSQNRKINSNNVSGHAGVSLHTRSGLWRAAISVSGVCKEIGYFKCPHEAGAAYVKAKAANHTFSPSIRSA